MTGYRFSQRSLNNLNGVHPDLVACVVIALYKFTEVDFVVIEGVRSLEQQREYYENGSSWTMDSKHLIQPDGFSHAVDLAPWVDGDIPWEEEDWKYFEMISEAMFRAADFLNKRLEWGGNWRKRDGPHYQI